MRLTALPPPPPTPITLILATLPGTYHQIGCLQHDPNVVILTEIKPRVIHRLVELTDRETLTVLEIGSFYEQLLFTIKCHCNHQDYINDFVYALLAKSIDSHLQVCPSL